MSRYFEQHFDSGEGRKKEVELTIDAEKDKELCYQCQPFKADIWMSSLLLTLKVINTICKKKKRTLIFERLGKVHCDLIP